MALEINKLKQIVKLLCESAELSNREIAEITDVAPNSVNKLAKQLPTIPFGWDELRNFTDLQFLKAFGRVAEPKVNERYPNWLLWHTELQKEKDVTVKLLWDEWHTENPNGISYSHANRLYSQWLGKQRISMRKINLPGENAYLDFAGRKMMIYHRDGTPWHLCEIFVAALGASSYSFCCAVRSQTLPDWIECNVKTLEFYGGVPRYLIPDNLKSAVTKHTRELIVINPTYAEMAEHYGSVVLPTRVRKPDDKGPVEVAVKLIQRWILAALRNRKFYSLEELNAEIQRLLKIFNNKEMKAYKASRRERFEILDKPALKMLPDTAYQFATWKMKVRVADNYHVLYETHYYSVPHELRNSSVDIRAGTNSIEIMHNGRRVATHILNEVSGGYTTDKHHMPANHQQYADSGVDKLLEWAKAVGNSTWQVFDHHLTDGRHQANGIRTAVAIQKLGRQHSPQRLEEVCEYALKINSITHSSILSIFRTKADKRPDGHIKHQEHDRHDNIRGGEYFKLASGE